MEKGLLCTICRPGNMGDCTNGGVSSRYHAVILVGTNVPPVFETEGRESVLYLHFRPQFRDYIAAPSDYGSGRHYILVDYLNGGRKMTVKELNQRLRLLEPHERLAITAGEVRALLNYNVARVVEEIGTMVSGARIGVRTNNLDADSGPAWDALCSVSYYIQDMPHFDKAKEYGEWPRTMELDD